MRPLVRRIDLYLGRTVLLSMLGAGVVLLGFDLILALVNELDEIGEGGYTLSHAVLFVAYTIPRRMYELYPVTALIGTVMGLGGLAARSELTAMRAVGLSRLRIGLGSLAALALVALLMIVNAETLAPAGEQSAQGVVNAAKTGDIVVARVSGLWAREGNVFLNARDGVKRRTDGVEWTELRGVRLFEFDDEGKLLSLAEARRGRVTSAAASCGATSTTCSATTSIRRRSRTRTGAAGSTRSTSPCCAWRRCRSRSVRCAPAASASACSSRSSSAWRTCSASGSR